ncbi:protein YAE1-like isoform X1 [Coffea eugenioides]|uniref:protein YAE1-like isoform X1 n=1 Tax=Coffea eugenioides TaxID=49369 RepID=UPI000F60A3DA|nr:protein YAE1-like isoform X1 [Coffea eugenioides]XP_027163464.1 protein YAE1-like isoform X1 [Coffea eugenioides]XP_027163465.1 protein YAE1-like isoform X1 [Coffea eugenioides]
MERSIADELYCDLLNVSNIHLDPRSNVDGAVHNSHDSDGDELWYDDGALPYETEKVEKAFDMEREWQRRREQFHTIGYRDGLVAGKEASAQEGFNIGFKESVFVGQAWGLVRGVTSAWVCLPDGVKEGLVETEEKRNKLRQLHESVRGISATDALKLFHDHLNNNLMEHGENAETGSNTGDLRAQCSGANVIEHYVREFNLLLVQCSAMDVHLE